MPQRFPGVGGRHPVSRQGSNGKSRTGTTGGPCKRMRRFDNLLQSLARDMGIDLRRRDIGMSQEGLYASEIGPALHEMSRESMPQNMRRQPLRIDSRANRDVRQKLVTA